MAYQEDDWLKIIGVVLMALLILLRAFGELPLWYTTAGVEISIEDYKQNWGWCAEEPVSSGTINVND